MPYKDVFNKMLEKSMIRSYESSKICNLLETESLSMKAFKTTIHQIGHNSDSRRARNTLRVRIFLSLLSLRAFNGFFTFFLVASEKKTFSLGKGR